MYTDNPEADFQRHLELQEDYVDFEEIEEVEIQYVLKTIDQLDKHVSNMKKEPDLLEQIRNWWCNFVLLDEIKRQL